MARNLKRDYLKKLLGIETRNGYKIDINNYIYNPSHHHEYPGLIKTTGETETTITKTRFYYMKYWDGTGEYIKETYTGDKNGDTWQILTDRTEEKIEASNRFNLNKLIAIAEAY
jgi:hypothetical protein